MKTGIGKTRLLAVSLLLGACAPVLAGGKTVTVVMLGDSTTLCAANQPGAKLTDRVQTYLDKATVRKVTVVNSGKGSDTVKGGYARLQEDVFAHRPDVVTVSFGLNDTGKLTPQEYREHMEDLVRDIRRTTRAKILLVTSTPFNNARHAWGAQFSTRGGLDEYMDTNICATVRSLAAKHKLALCDLHSRFLDKFKQSPALVDKLLCPDGVHLTDEGNRVAAEYLAPMIAQLIVNRKPDKPKEYDDTTPSP
jgi:lysophospholipase L1-like esterase